MGLTSLLPWHKNGKGNTDAARLDIAQRYLTLLRLALMDAPAPHKMRECDGEDRQLLEKIMRGSSRFSDAITMIGNFRLQHLGNAVTYVLRNEIPGDFLEAGAWRGGACIYLRALLDVAGVRNRKVWVCDAFDKGFPAPDPRFEIDAESKLHERGYFATPLDLVKRFFDHYGYLDSQVCFVAGPFAESIPSADIGPLAILRLDGDLYGSTWTPLELLYDKVSPGGWVIVDDYYMIPNAQMAVDDFRREHHVKGKLMKVDFCSTYWIKE